MKVVMVVLMVVVVESRNGVVVVEVGEERVPGAGVVFQEDGLDNDETKSNDKINQPVERTAEEWIIMFLRIYYSPNL